MPKKKLIVLEYAKTEAVELIDRVAHHFWCKGFCDAMEVDMKDPKAFTAALRKYLNRPNKKEAKSAPGISRI